MLSATAIKKESNNPRNTRAENVFCWHDNCHFWSGELREKTCICRGRAERENFVQGKMELNQSASNLPRKGQRNFILSLYDTEKC